MKKPGDEVVSVWNKWAAAHFIGRCRVNVNAIHPIGGSMVIRDVDWAHVKKLTGVFTKMQKIHDDISIVIWLRDEGVPQLDVKAPSFEKTIGDLAKGHDTFAFVGGHSVEACRSLYNDGHDFPGVHSPEVRVFIDHRTDESVECVEALGRMDNVKHENVRKVTDCEKLHAAHATFEAILQGFGKKPHAYRDSKAGKKELKNLLTQGKKKIMVQYSMNSNSVIPLWAHAQRTGDVWDALSTIMTGGYNNEKGLPAKRFESISRFTQMQGIEDCMVLPILQGVVRGNFGIRVMHDKFANIKTRAKIRNAIMMVLGETSWRVCIGKYPLSTSANVIGEWMFPFGRLSKTKLEDALPPKFSETINALKKIDLGTAQSRSRAARGEQKVRYVNLLSLLRCLSFQVFFFHLYLERYGVRDRVSRAD